jgi:transcriptional regulator with XRE-family HTH domain
MKKANLPSIRSQNELKKLGADISVARKRRSMTQARLAEGAGINVSTVRRLEAGDYGISLGVLAMVLLVLGELPRLGSLIDMAKDDIGLALANQKLPKRIRPKAEEAAITLRSVDTPNGLADEIGVAF